ncbi:Leucyl aminopeptidase [Saliniradius amylolyticus]|uniref:Leucyl aminopeptidase n=1 Tax=Saliniradius amylolyticus TaxID=2183582 RepID=A0A2S2DZY9_9ALTE|nr:peptidase M17 [Saliniradius amylolyticus]AWL10964.1 Leucyl aminopeptidase [Saliniradius amylolyticus]
MAFPKPFRVTNLNKALEPDGDWDAVIFIAPNYDHIDNLQIKENIDAHHRIDSRVGQEPLLLISSDIAGGRLIYSPTGPLERDYDDVRRFGDAAKAAAKIALDAGARHPVMVLSGVPDNEDYAHAIEVAYLNFCQALWQPLEAREALTEEKLEPIAEVGIYAPDQTDLDWLAGVESGRRVARDLCGTEPERMSPPGFAAYCEQTFKNSEVACTVISDDDVLRKNYPLLHAVARASTHVPRHQPRVVRLEYTGEGEIQQTLFIVGKGIVYDTGGADLKTDGHMAGMSRDKGGAAAAAGFMKILAELKPKGIKVVAALGVVRNSIGSDAFVADEIITAHSGVRVRIGNTDAEGRLVMADLLSELREEAQQAVSPTLFTIATLTGHVVKCYGQYTACVENGPARSLHLGDKLVEQADQWGDPAEVTRSRREDYEFIKGRTQADDVLSSNNASSAATSRGHQFPMAFLDVASGLAKNGSDSDKPLPYMHLDIAGSAIDGPDIQHNHPSGAPVVALAARYLRSVD